jgi:2-iminobutanoate/2-iminopropanoate deaminase
MGTITNVTTGDAPQPLGHYVQATVHDGIVYVSGQLAVRADGTHTVGANFEEQARQALCNLLSIVRAAGGSPGSILKVTAYIVGVDNWPELNRIYREILGEARPARSVVPVPALHHGYLIELDAVAACADGRGSARDKIETST